MGTTRLQGIGIVPTIPNRRLKVGDILVYNYGSKATITKIIKETKSGRLIAITDDNGEKFEVKKMNRGSSVVIDKNNRFKKA